MKKFITILISAVLCIAFAFSAPAIQQGDSGGEVASMQKQLILLGYLEGEADGQYGPMTEAAVQAFCSANGLTGGADGAMLALLQEKADEKFHGDAVSELDSIVQQAGQGAGTAPEETQPEEKKLWTKYKRSIVGEYTIRNAINRKYGRPEVTFEEYMLDRFGAEGLLKYAAFFGYLKEDAATLAVSELQKILKEKGFLEGEPDGTYGQTTVEAVKKFQKEEGLEETGTADLETVKALFRDDTEEETEKSSEQETTGNDPQEPETRPHDDPADPAQPQTQPTQPAPTEPQTQPQRPTEPQTEPPTQRPTEPQTEPPTQRPTEPQTEPPTQRPTEPQTTAHSHSYSSSVTSPATCTSNGVRTYTCSCGSSYTESIPATGHSYQASGSTQATCTADGYTTYVCSGCGDSYQEMTQAATGHVYEEVVYGIALHFLPPQYVCNICGYMTTDVFDIGRHVTEVCGGGYYVDDYVLDYEENLGEYYPGMACDGVRYAGDRCIYCGEWR